MRKTHLVGTWPGLSAPNAIATALQRVGAHLLRMTDGETGDRSLWASRTREWLRVNPDVELVHDGVYTGYGTGPLFRVRDGQTLDPANLHLNYFPTFAESFPAFKYLRDRAGHSDIRFQVGLPAPFDLTMLSFGLDVATSDRAISEAWAQATVDQVNRIVREADEPVVFQIETPASLVAMARAPEEARKALAERLAQALHEVVAGTPDGTHFGVHLCLGDLKHQALAELSDTQPLVLLANAVATGFPPGRILDYIHAPFAAAEKPGSFDEGWYRPLEALALPSDVRFVAGFIHESLTIDDHRRLLDMIERFARREVDVAAACGLGRRPDPAQAWDAMDKAVALITGT
ncbi:hypothetical protein [Amycolatopsis jejuensis]|uniref:hypothetical protein n=1 Tax=Amycolatopsis jejuensis TaxID=330084 RepID=UPI00069258C2|nr:hypothetical protein [Amycolatopsis jejuensis]